MSGQPFTCPTLLGGLRGHRYGNDRKVGGRKCQGQRLALSLLLGLVLVIINVSTYLAFVHPLLFNKHFHAHQLM